MIANSGVPKIVKSSEMMIVLHDCHFKMIEKTNKMSALNRIRSESGVLTILCSPCSLGFAQASCSKLGLAKMAWAE